MDQLAKLSMSHPYCFSNCMPGKESVPLNAGILGLYLQHRLEGNYYLCEHTHLNGELGTAGWGGVEVQAVAEDVQVCNQGFHR